MTWNICGKVVMHSLFLALLLNSTGGIVQAKEPGENPIGFKKMHAPGAEMQPVYASEIGKETKEVKAKVDKMADEFARAKVNPEADSVKEAWPDSISLEHHLADIAEIRDKFTHCMTSMEQKIEDKEATGTATEADRAVFKKCMDHCNAILKTMNEMHYRANAITTATKKLYFLNSWDKHQKLMAKLKSLMMTCPSLMKEAMDCCKIQGKAAGSSESKSSHSYEEKASQSHSHSH